MGNACKILMGLLVAKIRVEDGKLANDLMNIRQYQESPMVGFIIIHNLCTAAFMLAS